MKAGGICLDYSITVHMLLIQPMDDFSISKEKQGSQL
jgi:hypothetical protein